MRKSITAVLLILLTSHVILAQDLDFSGFARTYEGLSYKDGNFIIMQQTLNLNFEKRGERVAFKANPMMYLYNADSLDFNMREIYMDMYFKNFDLRIGKQQIVWGKSDGVFITDIVSPLNLTEFLLPDFDEIRKGVVAAKLDYYLGSHTIEAIWIPLFTPTTRPAEGSIWYTQSDFPAPVTFDWQGSDIDPSLANSELFLKYSVLTSVADFEFMGGYTWDDSPSMHVQKNFGMDPTTGLPVLSSLDITPEYHRLAVAGGSFSSQIKSVILRGEAAYYNGKYFQTENPLATDALVQKNYLHYLLGIDGNIKGLNLSAQFIQEAILDYDEYMTQEDYESTLTLRAQYNMLRETLHLELFSYIGLSNSDALIRPKITYDFDDSFSILLGSNIFVGDAGGRFGQYHDNSMIYTKIKYSF